MSLTVNENEYGLTVSETPTHSLTVSGTSSPLTIASDDLTLTVSDTPTSLLTVTGSTDPSITVQDNNILLTIDQSTGSSSSANPFDQNLNTTDSPTFAAITVSGTVDGRDLSVDGTKLDGIAVQANKYVHPTYTSRSINTSGASVLDEFTSDVAGHVTNITTRTLTLADLGYTGAADANKYVLPTSFTARNINTSGAHVLDTFTSDTSGRVTGITTRPLLLADIGYTGATDANKFIHPTETARTISVDATGADVVDAIAFTSDTLGHVTSASATKRTLTLADLGYTGATNADVTPPWVPSTNPNYLTSVTASDVGLGNVTNESKATMFASPTFTGTVSGVSKTHVGLGNVTNESKATMFTGAALTGNSTATTQLTGDNSTRIATTAYVKGQNYLTSVTATDVGLGNVTNESKATMFASPTFTGTVSGVSKTHVGLGNVTNESKATMFTGAALTGNSTATTQSTGNNSTRIATTAYVKGQNYLTSVTASDVGLGNVTNESKATMFASPTFTGTVSGVSKTHVGLGNVTNESKATMFTGAALTGNSTATTQLTGDNSTRIATTAYVKGQSYLTSVTASDVGLGNVTNESKATMFASPTFTGTVSGVSKTHVGLGNVTNESKATMFTGAALTGNSTATTQLTGDDSTRIATTAYVKGQSYLTSINNSNWSGTQLTIANGGTNATTATAALSNLGASPLAGSSSITTLGTVTTGVWNGSVISSAYLDADTAHLSTDQTFTGELTFSGLCIFDNDTSPAVKIISDDFAEGLQIHRNHSSNAAGIKFSNNDGQKGILYVDNGGVIRWRPLTSSSNLAIWHEGNDGAGSGLDADTLDAQQGSYYLNYSNFTNTPTIPSLSGYATESFVNTALAAKAPLASPTFTGTPLAPTPTLSDSTTKVATTAYVKGQNYLTSVTATDVGLGNVTNESKATMFTGAALTGNSTATTQSTGNNSTRIATTAYVKGQNYLTSVTATDVGLGNVTNESKATMFTGAALTGNSTAVTQSTGNNSTRIATTAYVKGQNYITSVTATDVGLGNVTNESKATMFASPTFTGTPLAPTPTLSDNTTKVATTAFVKGQNYLTSVTATDVGLGNVTNESKATMFASPTFTGTPTGITPTHIGLSGNQIIDWTAEAPTYIHADNIPTIAYSSLSGKPTIPSGNQIIDWTADQGSTDIHVNNLPTIPYSSISGTPAAAQIVDWTVDQGSTDIHADNISEASVTQHQGELSITESQISDLGTYLTASSTDLDSRYYTETETDQFLNLKANLASPTFTGTVSGVSKTHVGLGNVTNESKATMFASPTFTGTVSGVSKTHVGLGNVTNESKATMFTSPTFTGTVNVSEKIAHDGDSNTYMQLTTDQINFYAGNVRMLTLQESTHDQIVINENGADVNFRIESNLEANAFYIDGAGSGAVGIGKSTPAAKLDVDGTIAHKVYTVSTLPSASPAGQRAFVSDSYYSLQASHGSGVSGSGSNFVPVYSDGSNWFNG